MFCVDKQRPLFLWFAVAALSGCAQWPPPVKLGNAVTHNKAVHIVNPDPRWGTTPPDLDGQRGALLMRRYDQQEVIQPEEVDTTEQ
jgi:hypothetical protein